MVVTGYRQASKLRALLGQASYRRALRHRVAACIEHQRTPLLHDYRTVLDVGANRGQFALVAAHRFPRAALVCLEPQAGPRAILGRVLADHPRVRILDAAAAATDAVAVFHVSSDDGSSSLRPTTELQVETFPGTAVVGQVRLPTQRLDALVCVTDLQRPTLLKIDVQGTELEVLTGAQGILAEVDTILVECSFVELYAGQALAHDVVTLLLGNGFYLTNVVSPTVRDGMVVQADLVFEQLSAAKR